MTTDPTSKPTPQLKEVTLLHLLKDSTYGAANLGAKKAGFRISLDFSSHAEIFFHHKAA
jgi:hypothetical protein